MHLSLHMVMSFRVSELQVLLGFAGRNKSGRKHELLTKALQLLKSGCSPAVQMKIKELYRRRFPRKILTPSDLSMLHLQTVQLPSATALTQGAMCHLPYNNGSVASPVPAGMLPPVPMLGPKHEPDVSHLSPPIHPVHPDVKMKRLPFYDVYDELIKPTTLASMNSQRFEEGQYSFVLTPQQVQQILTSRDMLPGAKCDYSVQVQLRFCLCETSCPQEDYFPPNLFVKVNGKLCPLPGYLPPTKNGAEPKRPSRPINITPLVRLSATVPNSIVVNWSSEFGRTYSLSVYLVKQLTSVTLLQKLRAKGIRNPDHSRALIKEKLTADIDSEIATTSLRVSLMCPLGKMRLTVPCRAYTCTHLQCFDGALYLQMNEKKPTWTCPVCDKKAPYEALIIDGLFVEILNLVTDCDEIQFMEDGSWCPMKPKKENQEVCQPSAYNGVEANSLYLVGPDGKQLADSKKKVEVIDLTLDSSSDDEEPPAKKQCPVTTAAIPSAVGPKGGISADHQPSSVLRSPPMAAVGSDYLSSLPIPDYHPSYQVPSDIQGLDLFSFLQSENQHYSPSVITSLDEQDTLSHFFQYRGPSPHFMNPLAPVMVGSHGAVGSSSPGGRLNSVVSSPSVALRENHGHNNTVGGSPVLPSCRPDIISLD
ncbi:E3 SUMO-protein ligase PIAS3 isoform X2 [Sphaerodactylus townsendi]|uniref:E3 SUMO-protein ligase PIAS3 isoform X2 n=1 Tax=Sphaerodactylus townsendi TaxID=933632 RepID=UPI00202724EB|nr:E3 SUMO-protein ligase PIAS3 isoform X2 [Sphaerodactylus townsendi]XP_048369696.1 E3 SUMO-protein ligase PIAS3 isoform X2 [Sphaerodactylus townsendi]